MTPMVARALRNGFVMFHAPRKKVLNYAHEHGRVTRFDHPLADLSLSMSEVAHRRARRRMRGARRRSLTKETGEGNR
jgi:hypothetical protein